MSDRSDSAPNPSATMSDLNLGARSQPDLTATLVSDHLPAVPRPPVGLPALPGYEALGSLGKGGMGVVYLARQLTTNRLVAIKMVKSGFADADEEARFRTEAEAVAALDHPNVVQVYEVDRWTAENRSLPYMVLEYCDRGSLARWLAGSPLPPREAAWLVVQIAQGVQAAHARGIIHRDLKPDNVFLKGTGPGSVETDPDQGKSVAGLVPKVADFGLARREQAPGLTQTGAILGTPSYMAPEQAKGDSNKVGVAADVYALGAILYECLTGRPPFRAATTMETMLLVLHEEAPSPRGLVPSTPRELEAICGKCLHKDPARRYASARDVADDLTRFLQHEPIHARPVGAGERLLKWVRRRPAIAALTAAVIVAVVAGMAGVGFFAYQADQARQVADQRADREAAAKLLAEAEQKRAEKEKARAEAETARAEAETARAETQARRLAYLVYANQLNLAQQALAEDNPDLAWRYLEETPWDLRGWEFRLLWTRWNKIRLAPVGEIGVAHSLAISPDGKTLACADGKRLVRLWDIQSNEQLLTVSGVTSEITTVAFSPDSTRFATAGYGSAQIWDTSTGQEVMRLPGRNPVVYSPDGRTIVTGSEDETLKGWDAETGQERFTLKGRCVAYSRDGTRLVSADGREITIWDARTGREIRSMRASSESRNWIENVVFSPDGTRVASASGNSTEKTQGGEVRLWDVESGQELANLRGHNSLVEQVVFTPDGRRLVSASWDNTIKIWDVEFGMELLTLKGHTDWVRGLVFSPDGGRLYSAGQDKTLRQWDASRQPRVLSLRGHYGQIYDIAYRPDGKRLASAGSDKLVKVWNMLTGQEVFSLKGHDGFVQCVAYSPDGRLLASGADKVVKLWDAEQGKEIRSLNGHGGDIVRVAFNAAGGWLLTGDNEGTIKVWDVETGEEVSSLEGKGKRHGFSAQGPKIDFGDRQFTINVRDTVALSPDGRQVAWGGNERAVKVGDLKTGRELFMLDGHTWGITCLAYSADSRYLVSGSLDKSLRLWDARTGESLQSFLGHTDSPKGAAFSPDGRLLASAGHDFLLRVWDVETGQAVLSTNDHRSSLTAVVFSPDGRKIASTGYSGLVKIRDTPARKP